MTIPGVCTDTNTSTLEWKWVGELSSTTKGLAGPVAGINNDVFIVAGGSNFPDSMPWLGGKKKYYNKGYVFKKTKNDSLICFKSFDLPFNLAYAAGCGTTKGIVVAGGENEKGISNKVLLIQWNQTGDDIIIQNLPALPFAVTNAALTCKDDKLYLAGGEINNGVSNNFLLLDLNDTSKGWQQLPHLPQAVSHAVMVMQSDGVGSIYLIGGRKKNDNGISDLYAYTFAFDFIKNEWVQKQSLPYALSAGTGIATGKNYMVLFGGDKGKTFHKTEMIIAAINAEKNDVKKKQLIEEKARLQSAHPGFSKEVLMYNTVEDKWKVIDTMPFPVPVTTTATQWNDQIYIPGGEIKAGVRTTQILSAKIDVK